MTIAEFRKDHPEYNDIGDVELGNKLYEKFYSDIPKQEFMTKFIGMTEKPALSESVNPQDMAIRQDYPVRRQILRGVVRPTLELGGMAGGAIGGAPAGPVGSVAGAGLGYAGGVSLANALETFAGVYHPKNKPVLERLKEIPKNVQTGILMELLGRAGGSLTSFLSAPFSKSSSPEALNISKLAAEKQVPLTPAEATQSKGLSQFENFLRNIPGSSGILQREHDIPQLQAMERLQQSMAERSGAGAARPIEELGQSIQESVVQDITARQAAKTGTLQSLKEGYLASRGTTQSALQGGEKILGSLKTESSKRAVLASEPYKNLPIANNDLVNVNPVRLKAKQLLAEYAAQPKATQDRQIIGLLEEYTNMPPKQKNLKWANVLGLRQGLNSIIFKESGGVQAGTPGYRGMTTPEGRIAKELKDATDEVIKLHSERTGGTLKPALDEANRAYAEFKSVFGDQDIKRILFSNPERIFNIVAKPGAVSEFNVLKEAVGEQGIQPIREMLSTKLLGTGELSSETLTQNIAKYGEDTISNILGQRGLSELKALASGAKQVESIPIGSPFFKTIAKTSPEKVFDTTLRTTHGKTLEQIDAGNIDRLNALRPVIGPGGIDDLKAKMMEKALNLNAEGPFNPAAALKIYRSFGPRTARALLGPEGINEMENLARLESVTKGASKLAANPSGTGQSLISAGYFGMTLRGYKEAIQTTFSKGGGLGAGIGKGAETTFDALLLPRGLAKIYLSKPGRKYLLSAYKIKPGTKQAIELSTKLLAIAGTDGYEIKDSE